MTAVTHITFGTAERAACHFARLPLTFAARNKNNTQTYNNLKKVKVKAVCGSYSTAALRHIVLLTEWVPSFISRGAVHTKRRERPPLEKEGTIPGI